MELSNGRKDEEDKSFGNSSSGKKVINDNSTEYVERFRSKVSSEAGSDDMEMVKIGKGFRKLVKRVP